MSPAGGGAGVSIISLADVVDVLNCMVALLTHMAKKNCRSLARAIVLEMKLVIKAAAAGPLLSVSRALAKKKQRACR